MILFFNTYLMPGGVGIEYDRGLLRNYDKVDVLMYSLASFANAYPWKKVILNIGLDSCYHHKKDELEYFIKKEFAGQKLSLYWHRIYKQSEWQEKYFEFDDHVVWYCGNHDHIYIDNDLNYLKDLVKKAYQHEDCLIPYSHFPEHIFCTYRYNNNYLINENSIDVYSDNVDGVHILTKELYKKWWFGKDVSDYDFPRPDWHNWLRHVKGDIPIALSFVPYRELCRHFDGYAAFGISNNICPAIEIPNGFFDNDIKISYGNFDNKLNFTNLNPLNKNYKAFDINGTDYKWNLEDIPSFWKNRISYVEKHNINQEISRKCRHQGLIDMFNFWECKLLDKIKERILFFYRYE